MHLHRLHRHRLQAGAESLSGPQLSDGAEPAALWMTDSETLKLRCETLTFHTSFKIMRLVYVLDYLFFICCYKHTTFNMSVSAV